MGHMKLRKDDPASDDSKASAFWELLEELVKEYMTCPQKSVQVQC
jgi:hypothetical protein